MKSRHANFMLFIIGNSPKSEQARRNALQLCAEENIRIVDITQEPDMALKYGVLATPTFLRTSDCATVIGTMDDVVKIGDLFDMPFESEARGGRSA